MALEHFRPHHFGADHFLSWGLTYEASQDDLSPRGRSSFVKFQPVRRGAAVLAPVSARVAVSGLVAVGVAGFASASSQAAAVQLGVLAAVASTIRVTPKGATRIQAAVRLTGVAARAYGRPLTPFAGAAIAPCVATATGHLQRLHPGGGGAAGMYPGAAGARLYPVSPTGVQNLSDDELIGLFLQARRKALLTVQVNRL